MPDKSVYASVGILMIGDRQVMRLCNRLTNNEAFLRRLSRACKLNPRCLNIVRGDAPYSIIYFKFFSRHLNEFFSKYERKNDPVHFHYAHFTTLGAVVCVNSGSRSKGHGFDSRRAHSTKIASIVLELIPQKSIR